MKVYSQCAKTEKIIAFGKSLQHKPSIGTMLTIMAQIMSHYEKQEDPYITESHS